MHSNRKPLGTTEHYTDRKSNPGAVGIFAAHPPKVAPEGRAPAVRVHLGKTRLEAGEPGARVAVFNRDSGLNLLLKAQNVEGPFFQT